MTGLVTLVISLLAGVIVITMTCPPVVAIITVVGICFVGAIVAKAMGKI
jgi:xanthosine utilization system XapX-like protein